MEGRISSVLFADRPGIPRRHDSPQGPLSPCSPLSMPSPSYGTYPASRTLEPKVADVKQADLDRSLTHKQAELTHFQLNQVKEQLTSLNVEMTRFRQDSEAVRAVVRDMQSEFERETFSRRKDGEEFLSGLAQLKHFLDQERLDRTQGLRAIEQDMAEQSQTVKLQHQQQLESTSTLSKSFEASCADLRAALEKETSERVSKIEAVQREFPPIVHSLEKETRERMSSIADLTTAITSVRTDLEPRLEKESSERKHEMEELARIERQERKAMGDRLDDKIKEEFAQSLREADRLDAKCADIHRLMQPLARYDEVQAHLKNFAQRFNELVDSLSEVKKSQTSNYVEVRNGLDMLSDVFRAGDSEFKHMLDMLSRNLTEDIERERAWNSELHQEHHNRDEQVEKVLRKVHVDLHLVTLRLSEQQRDD